MEENRQKALAKRVEKGKNVQGATAGPASTSLIRPAQGATGPASTSLVRRPMRPATGSTPQDTFTSGGSTAFSSRPTPSGGTFNKPPHSSTLGSPTKNIASSSSMIRPARGTSQQSKQPSGGNSSDNSKAPPGGNFNKTVQQYMNTSGYPGSGASFATGKPPQNIAQSALTPAYSTSNKQPHTQSTTFYASNPTPGNVNRPQGSWTPRPGSGSGKSTGTTSGQYRPQNPGGHFQGKGPYDKNQNQNRFSSQKGSSTAGASPTKLVNQLFNEAAKTKGSCGLISRTRFEVNVIYHAKLIELFKSMSTRQYNSENRRWSFHLKEYETLMNKMGDLRSEIHLEPLPRSVLQVLYYTGSRLQRVRLLRAITSKLSNSIVCKCFTH